MLGQNNKELILKTNMVKSVSRSKVTRRASNQNLSEVKYVTCRISMTNVKFITLNFLLKDAFKFNELSSH